MLSCAQIQELPRASANPKANSAARPVAAPPDLHRLPARQTEPPFDGVAGPPFDGVTGQPFAKGVGARPRIQPVQGTLALAFALPSGLPAVPATPELPDGVRRLRLVPALPLGTANPATAQDTHQSRRAGRGGDDESFGPQPTARALLPEPRVWAGRLVQAVVEVTVGRRPLAQLLRWTTTDVYDSVRYRIAHAGTGVGIGARTGVGTVAASGAAPRVRSVHVDEPRDGVAEVCAVVQHGPRCRAIALRLEGLDGRWQCTALQVC